jgi:hypothetical protein
VPASMMSGTSSSEGPEIGTICVRSTTANQLSGKPLQLRMSNQVFDRYQMSHHDTHSE